MYNWEFESAERKKSGSPKVVPVKKESSSSASAGSSDDSSVECELNTIYFYSSVTQQDNFALNKYLAKLSRDLPIVQQKYKLDAPIPVHFRINSYGGSVFAAFSTLDYMNQTQVPIYTYIDGCAASAGTIMSVCGNKRFIGENSYMLVHQLSSQHWGKYQELQDDMKNSDSLMKRIKEIYEEKTKIPKTKMDEILKHDLWWDAKTCLRYGLVDEILT
jgi:ATP-dependent protease ClpP protease subunit